MDDHFIRYICNMGEMRIRKTETKIHHFKVISVQNETLEMLKIGKTRLQTNKMAQIQPKYAYSYVI